MRRTGGIREVPREMLERGREMAGFGREIWLAGLGVFAVAGERGSHLFDELVKAGEELEKKGKAELSGRQKELADTLEEQVYEPMLSALRRVGVPGRGDMRELTARLDRITHRVDELVTRMTHGGKGGGAPAGTVKVFRVFAEEGGWAVRRGEEKEAVGVHPTKDEALEQARALAREHQPSRLDVYRKDGTLQDTLEF
jgi:polyhydroxyalkanoate synthesis regulator phasin